MADQKKNRPKREDRQESNPKENEENQVDADRSTMDREKDKKVEYVSTQDSAADDEGDAPLTTEGAGDMLEVGTDPDRVMEVIEEFTDDEDVLDDFAERQGFNASGSDELLQKLLQHNSRTPAITADDVDADWENADQSGEETVGGTVPTPDKDIVDEIGEAAGITYADDEPLQTADILAGRDQARWELDPASAESDLDDENGEEDEDEVDEDLLDDFEDLDEDEDVEQDELVLDEEVEDSADLEDLADMEELDDLDADLDEHDDDWEDLDDEDDWEDLDDDEDDWDDDLDED